MGLEPRTLILVRSEQARAALVRLAETLPWARARHLALSVVHGEVQQAVAACRERDLDAPIGLIAEDEPSVLAALAGGADDATVLTHYEAAPFAAFVDRTELRAQLRGESRRLQDTFAHTERLTALGTLVAGVGHEINNPLSAVMLSIEVARRHLLPAIEAAREVTRNIDHGEPPAERSLATLRTIFGPERDAARGPAAIFDEMGAAAEAIASIVRDLRTFARSDQDEAPEPVEIPELIDHAIRLSGREASRRGVLERDYAPDLPTLLVPRGRVTQVIMNVFVNALHAIGEIDREVHRVRIQARADEDFVAIAVSDTGRGIPPESLERIFDPFFTTKRQSLGTGLGLSISRAILRRLGGELSVESLYGEGATFLCFLPIPSPDALRESWRRTPVATSYRDVQGGANGTSVLVVEDDERMLRSYARLLGGRHRLMIAYDGREAVEMLESGSTPGILIIDLDVGGTDPRALLEWVSTYRPQLARRTVLITSASSGTSDDPSIKAYPAVVLTKPLRAEALLDSIGALRTDPRER